MKLSLLTPIICAATIALACGKSGNDNDDDDTASGGATEDGSGGDEATGSGGKDSASGGKDSASGGKGSGGDGESTGGKSSGGSASDGGSGALGGDGSGEGGAGEGGAGAMDGSGGTGNTTLVLTATDFEDGDALPEENTCEGMEFGDGESPELSWAGAPEGTVSYALVFSDTTLVDAGLNKPGYHWAAWNIPVTVDGIPASMSGEALPLELEGGEQFRAGPDVGHDAFFGPCPSWKVACELDVPRSNDSYQFTLYAFDKVLDVPDFDTTNYQNYVHQLNEFFLASSPLGKTGLNATSDAAPGVKPTVPACPVLTFTVEGMTEGGEVPAANSCEGKVIDAGISPKFSWSDPYELTQSYAVVVRNETSNRNLWVTYNIPATATGIDADVADGAMPAELSGGSQMSQAPYNSPPQAYPICPSWQTACPMNPPVQASSDITYTLYTFEKALTLPTTINALATYLETNAAQSVVLNVTSDAYPNAAPSICP